MIAQKEKSAVGETEFTLVVYTFFIPERQLGKRHSGSKDW